MVRSASDRETPASSPKRASRMTAQCCLPQRPPVDHDYAHRSGDSCQVRPPPAVARGFFFAVSAVARVLGLMVPPPTEAFRVLKNTTTLSMTKLSRCCLRSGVGTASMCRTFCTLSTLAGTTSEWLFQSPIWRFSLRQNGPGVMPPGISMPLIRMIFRGDSSK